MKQQKHLDTFSASFAQARPADSDKKIPEYVERNWGQGAKFASEC